MESATLTDRGILLLAMSEANVEIVRQAFEAWNVGPWRAWVMPITLMP